MHEEILTELLSSLTFDRNRHLLLTRTVSILPERTDPSFLPLAYIQSLAWYICRAVRVTCRLDSGKPGSPSTSAPTQTEITGSESQTPSLTSPGADIRTLNLRLEFLGNRVHRPDLHNKRNNDPRSQIPRHPTVEPHRCCFRTTTIRQRRTCPTLLPESIPSGL